MARSLSSVMARALAGQETAEIPLVLLTIEHPELTPALRLVRNTVDIVSRGESFTAFACDVTLPDDVEGVSPRASLLLDNTSLELVEMIRSLRQTPEVTIELVLASSPDTVEVAWRAFVVEEARWDARTIELPLQLVETQLEQIPAHQFTPGNFPSAFKGL
ncbi:MAG: DUF1833 family protein [Geminicoccaceae bacterium]